jgi:hypothetical protein
MESIDSTIILLKRPTVVVGPAIEVMRVHEKGEDDKEKQMSDSATTADTYAGAESPHESWKDTACTGELRPLIIQEAASCRRCATSSTSHSGGWTWRHWLGDNRISKMFGVLRLEFSSVKTIQSLTVIAVEHEPDLEKVEHEGHIRR